ncbi:MAG TPA: AEC family transporter [Candidatus Blautia intestinigallinarum]|nr:AEC family transporter [Candidatus Blautia intestinigallinarum]
MTGMVSLEVTMFFLILVGFAVKRFRLVGEAGKGVLTDLVVNLILPCNIIKSFMIEFDMQVLKGFLSILLISTVLQAGCILLGRLLYGRDHSGKSKCLQFGVICSNAGFLGNPVAEEAYGSMGLALASIYLIPQRIVMWSAGIAVFSNGIDKKQILKQTLTHPCIIACNIGLVLMFTQFPLPQFVVDLITDLSGCNTVLSMMVIGMILADINMEKIWDRDIFKFTVLRLLIIPALVYLPCRLLNMPYLVTGVSVMLAGMPAGATTSILALKYHADEEFGTNLVIFSTVCSIVTIPLWGIILG